MLNLHFHQRVSYSLPMTYDLRIGDFQIAAHPVRSHDFRDVGRTTAVVVDASLAVHLRETGHEGLVVDLDRVGDDLQDRLVLVRPEVLARRRGHAAQVIAGVGHAQLLDEIGAPDPGGEVDDLLAVEVDDAEVLAFSHFECEAVGGLDDVRLGTGLVVRSWHASELRKHHDGERNKGLSRETSR